MGIFQKKETSAPHIEFPEILHWHEGDRIKARNVTMKGLLSKMTAIETGEYILIYIYKGITRDGFIIVESEADNVAHKTELKKFLKKAENLSLKNRSIYSDLESSNEYMKLMEEFQRAYLELKEADDQKLLQ